MTAGRNPYRGRNVLVTGGLGFIGSNLAIRLAAGGAEVTVVDSLDPTCGGNPFNIEPVKGVVAVRIGDVTDGSLMRELVRPQQYVFHLAGHVSHIQSMEDPFNDLDLNCRTTLSLLEACRRVNTDARVVFAGTRQAYGRAEALPITESHVLRPVDVNGVTKMAAEGFHLVYHNVHGVKSVSLRLVNTFGPRQLVRHSRQGFIGWFVRLAMSGAEIPIFGDGQQLRDINYVDDVVEALLVAGASESVYGDVFNLGSSAPVSREDFVRTLIRVAGKGSYRIVPFPADRKAIDIGSVFTDHSKFKTATGWTPRVSLEAGLEQTVRYYAAHRDRYW